MDHLNPRSPLVFDASALGRRPGSMERVQRTIEAPADFGTEMIVVPAGAVIELELRLESVVEGVLVTGSAQATATGACVRCLDPVSQQVDAAFQELFAYADRAAHHREVGADEDEADEHTLEGDLFDLEPVLRDAVVPALPFQPVCRADCPGLCSECGARLADDPDHQHELVDPRWSALRALATEPSITTPTTMTPTTPTTMTPSITEEKRN